MSLSSTEAETSANGRTWPGKQAFEKLAKSTPKMPLPGKPAAGVHIDRVRAKPALAPTVSGSLGLFSIALGLAELLAPTTLRRELGLKHVPTTAVRTLYGLRELTAGWALVSDPTDYRWLWARVAGDVLDIATLKTGDTWANPKRGAVKVGLAAVYAITVVDVLTALRMSTVQRNCTQKG